MALMDDVRGERCIKRRQARCRPPAEDADFSRKLQPQIIHTVHLFVPRRRSCRTGCVRPFYYSVALSRSTRQSATRVEPAPGLRCPDLSKGPVDTCRNSADPHLPRRKRAEALRKSRDHAQSSLLVHSGNISGRHTPSHDRRAPSQRKRRRFGHSIVLHWFQNRGSPRFTPSESTPSTEAVLTAGS